MKIIEFRAENFKRLKVVDITPNGGLNQITGDNEQGKSSLLDSIFTLCGGAKAAPEVPIRTGAETARIRGRLGAYIVERKYSVSGKPTLTVRNAADYEDGTPDSKMKALDSPETLLKGLIGDLSFDPLKFCQMKPDDRYEALRNAAKLDVDIDALTKANDADYKTRTDLNRDAKVIRTRAEGIVPKDPPASKIDIAALASKLEEAAKHNGEIDTRAARRELIAKQIESDENETIPRSLRAVADVDKQILQLHDAKKAAEAHVESLRTSLNERKDKLENAEPLPEKIDVSAVRAELSTAQQKNQEFDRAAQRKQLMQEAVVIEKKAEKLTTQMADREAAMLKSLQNAELPAKGLSLAPGKKVLFNGLPFDQACESEQIRLSVEIAMAQNPELRVIFIRDGGALGKKKISEIAALATKNDYQIWMEKTDDSGKVGIVMVDGEVAAVNEEVAQ